MLVYLTPQPALEAAAGEIAQAVAESGLAPLPSRTFPLAEIAAAHELAETGPTGRVLLEIP